MLALLSPAKKLRESAPYYSFSPTLPAAMNEVTELSDVMREYSAEEFKKLTGVSDALAELNAARYAEFSAEKLTPDHAVPALLAFAGDVYQHISTASYGEKEFASAQSRLRILSGLYGLLRPFDLILPYRLEMGTKLPTERGKNLYDYWRDAMPKLIEQALEETQANLVVNLASQEYFKATQSVNFNVPIIHATFKERSEKGDRVVGIMAKRARGMMADFIVRHSLRKAEELKDFNQNNYRYMPDLSTAENYVFINEKPR